MNSTLTRPEKPTPSERYQEVYSELSRVRAELAAMKREKDRIAEELEKRKAETPSLSDFHPDYVKAARALSANRPDLDYMANVLYLCERWTYAPWLPDAPPVGGRMVPCPVEHCQPVARAYRNDAPDYMNAKPMTHISQTIKRLQTLSEQRKEGAA